MKLSDIENLRAPLSIAYRGLQIELTYFAEEIQAQIAAMAKRAEDEEEPFNKEEVYRTDSDVLAKLIAAWSLTGDDGQALPITADAILKFSPVLRRVIFLAIFEDIGRPLAPAAS
jgi:hypothetical protein